MEKQYVNNTQAVIQWFEKNGGKVPYDRNGFSVISGIAKDCMSVYKPEKGEPEIIGFFPYASIEGQNTQPEGVCFIHGNQACVGIRRDILKESGRNYSVIVGLHQLTHLSEPEHNEKFLKRFETLLYKYFSREDKKLGAGRLIGQTKRY